MSDSQSAKLRVSPAQEAQHHKREKFYTAAEPLFLRFGFRKTTVEDVCAAAGASKRTFYELFKDKSDLFARMAFHIAETMIDRWETRTRTVKRASKKLEILLDEYVRLSRERPVFRVFFDEPMLMKAFAQLSAELRSSPLMSAFSGLIHEGMRSGEFRKVDPETIPWIVYSLLDSMYFLMPGWTGLPGPLDDPKLARQVREFIFNGLGCRHESR